MKSRPVILFILSVILLVCTSCDKTAKSVSLNGIAVTHSDKKEEKPNRILPQVFKDYWYAGEAEITSYKLSQERYGELREGHAVSVFVTENFLPDSQVKADRTSQDNISVLKLNATKKFFTGIYPYSIMTSTFSPINSMDHAIKISNSVQEWCGQVYMQLNNRERYEIMAHSYFEKEADQSLSIEKTWLEDELWNLIRISPNELPTGNVPMVPSFEYIRMRHAKIGAFNAEVSLKQGDSISIYEIRYPSLERNVTIYFNSTFPFEIEKWEETNSSWGSNQEVLKTTATRMKRLKSAYWSKNSNSDVSLRDSLGLK